MVFILLGGVILLTRVSLRYFKREYVSPAVFLCLIFLISIFYSFYNFSRWELMDYGIQMIGLSLSGITSFVVAAMVPRIRHLRRKIIPNVVKEFKRIDISSGKIIIAVLVGIIAVAYYMLYLRRTTGHFGLNVNLASSIQAVRSKRQAGDLTDELGLPTLLNLLIKATHMFSALFAFIFVFNAVIKQRTRKDYFLLLPTVFHILVSLLQSNRGNILQMLISVVAMWYMTWHKVKAWNTNINKMFLRKMLVAIGIVAPLFFLATIFMGRYDRTTVQAVDPLYYIGVYISGGLRNFDLYLKQGGLTTKVFGEETFVSMNNWLASHFGIGEEYVRHLEFRFANGWGAGNIYTSFRRFYHDFGVFGVVILPAIQGFISSAVYERARWKKSKMAISFSQILYAFFAYTIIYVPIDDLFYSSVIAVSGLEKLILLYAIYFFIFRIKFENKIWCVQNKGVFPNDRTKVRRWWGSRQKKGRQRGSDVVQ